jgi:hypothetical protein
MDTTATCITVYQTESTEIPICIQTRGGGAGYIGNKYNFNYYGKNAAY